VALKDNIYVQSHIKAARYLALAIEQCWLSASPRVTSHAGPHDLRLVMAGCPVQSGVSMHWDPGSANAAFSFKVGNNKLCALPHNFFMNLSSKFSLGERGWEGEPGQIENIA
jgi:hypothetical protein